MPDAHADEIDADELLQKMTGQGDVREVDHAKTLLGIAVAEEDGGRAARDLTRWPVRRARLRMLPVWLPMPPLIASLILSSILIFTATMLLIVIGVGDALVIFAVICVGYTLGFGLILHLLRDGADEHDDNRATVRRRALYDAIEARLVASAKLERLVRETAARRALVEAVVNYNLELARRQRRRIRKPDDVPPEKPQPPPDVEYGGG